MNIEIAQKLILFSFNAFSVFLIIIVAGNSLKDPRNRWFMALALSLIGWVNSSYAGNTVTNLSYSLLFYRLNFAFVVCFIYCSYAFLVENILGVKNIVIKTLMLIGSTLLATMSFVSGLVVVGVTPETWGNNVVYGPLNSVYNAFALLAAGIIIYHFIRKYITYTATERQEIQPFLIGTLLLVTLNISFNIIFPLFFNTGAFQNFGDYSSVVFLAAAAYSIVRRHFLGIKVVIPAILISAMLILVVLDILTLSRSPLEQGVKAVGLIFFIAISVLLVRSVLNEVRQREELAKTNEALERNKQKLLELATEQKDIIDVMGHEIRTPLTAIVQEVKIYKKYVQPVEKELLQEAERSEHLKKALPFLLDTVKTVDRASAHAVALVTDMLETARLDKKRFSLNYEPFNLVEVVKASVELMAKTVDSSDPSLTYEVRFIEPSFTELPIEADKVRVGQAVHALLSNALKYRDGAKDIVSITVSIKKVASNAVIEVRDNGLGIDQEDISKLGKKFVRLNPRTQGNLPRPGGTGLGLFVVKGIMDYHKGELSISSKGLGHGSTFSLHLPTKKQ